VIETNDRDGDSDAALRHWEQFYQEHAQVWSGQPNRLLVREVAALTPGRALDLGCGEGGDAIWLARQGWRVTAVDISATALRRAAEHAAEAGVDGIEWTQHDLAQTFPTGSFDLVSAQFLHSTVAAPGERDSILRRAADSVAPGGFLLIGSHGAWPSWMDTPPHDHRFPTIAEMLDALALPPEQWHVDVADAIRSEAIGPEGQVGHREDTVVLARRFD
jgi:SAM-dependent methyltransferase